MGSEGFSGSVVPNNEKISPVKNTTLFPLASGGSWQVQQVEW